MKRTIALVLVTVLALLSLASCATQPMDNKTAEEALTLVQTKMQDASGIKIQSTMAVEASVVNIMSISYDMTQSAATLKTESSHLMDMTMVMKSAMTSALNPNEKQESTTSTSMKYNGEKLFVAMQAELPGMPATDAKKQIAVDPSTFNEKLSELMQQSGMSVNTDWGAFATGMKQATIEKKDGKYVITSENCGDALLQTITGSLSGIDSILPEDFTLGDCTISLTCTGDGFCEKADISLSFSFDVQGVTATMSLTGSFTYEKLPADFTVAAPEDAASYEEISSDEFFGPAE